MVRFVDYKKAKPNLEVNGWLNLINLLSHTHKINLFFSYFNNSWLGFHCRSLLRRFCEILFVTFEIDRQK